MSGHYSDAMDPTLEPFRGRCVAIGDDDEIVADAGSLAELRTVLRRVVPDQHVVVWRIPDIDDPLFIGVAAPSMA